MKHFSKFFTLLFLITIFISCEENPNENNILNQSNKISLKDGRLYFPTQQIFNELFDKYKDGDGIALSQYLDSYYDQGFYSLIPIVTERNENKIYNHYLKLKDLPQKNKQKKSSNKSNNLEVDEDYANYIDEIEDVIGDEVFAALLNQNAEIQIQDIIYKYTDVGLFYGNENKIVDIYDYLNLKNISDDLKIRSEESAYTNMKNEYPQSGSILINEDITYFKLIAPDTAGSEGGGGSYPSQGGGNPSANSSSDPSYIAYFSNLQNCDQIGGVWNWFSNIFGDNNVCIDHYENRRRVKTKAYNYNYFFVYHLGVKVVHQFRGWTGLWRSEAAEEIRLNVEAAQFEYDTNQLLNSAVVNNTTQERSYYINNQKILFQPNNMNFGNYTFTNLNHSSLPQIFQNDGMGLTFEFFGTGWTTLDNLIQGGIDSSLNAKKLNDYFYDGLYSTATTQLQAAIPSLSTPLASNRTFAAKFPENGKVIIQKSHQTIGYGNAIAQKTFDWGAEIQINVNQTGNGSWDLGSPSPGNQLIRPKNFRVKMIGAVRSGGSWHGSKFAVKID